MTLLQRLQTAVIHHPHLDARRIHYKTSGSSVRIEGKAKTYYEKQMAQEPVSYTHLTLPTNREV